MYKINVLVESVHSISDTPDTEYPLTHNVTGIAGKCGSVDNLRRGHILMCLRDFAATNEYHKQAIKCLISSPKFAKLEVPQLYKETFVDIEDDEPQNSEYS